MADYVYTTVPGKIKRLLGKIREVGVPSKVTNQWLKTIGFTSSNDGSLIGVLKYINFIDQSGVPTDRWNQFRGGKSAKVLGDAVQAAYANLFAVYPDAQQRSNPELENVFSTSSKGGKQVITQLVRTFKALADEAEFGAPDTKGELQIPAGPLHTPIAAQTTGAQASQASSPSLHIDIQIHISPEAASEQIDQIFASMAKHLYGSKK